MFYSTSCLDLPAIYLKRQSVFPCLVVIKVPHLHLETNLPSRVIAGNTVTSLKINIYHQDTIAVLSSVQCPSS